MKKWILLSILLLMIPLAVALKECKELQTPAGVPCNIVTPGDVVNCSNLQMKFYNGNGTVLDERNMTKWSSSQRCNTTFNYSTADSYVFNITNGDSGRLIVEGETVGASLGIILFFIILTLIFFILPVLNIFPKNELSRFALKRASIVIGLAFLSLTTNVMLNISEIAGIGVNNQVFQVMWFAMWSMWVGMVSLVIGIIIGMIKIMQKQADLIKMGDDLDEQ